MKFGTRSGVEGLPDSLDVGFDKGDAKKLAALGIAAGVAISQCGGDSSAESAPSQPEQVQQQGESS